MKCLSVSQPFADLVIKGRKTIELRSWNTLYRGRLLIHAPLKIKTEDCKRLKIKSKIITGCIIGYVELYDTKKYSRMSNLEKDYKKHLALSIDKKRYGFMLKDPRLFRVPIPYKGRLGIFDVKLEKQPKKDQIKTDIIDEEYRHQWISHH